MKRKVVVVLIIIMSTMTLLTGCTELERLLMKLNKLCMSLKDSVPLMLTM